MEQPWRLGYQVFPGRASEPGLIGAFAPGSLISREKQVLLLKGVRAAIPKETLVSIAALVLPTWVTDLPALFGGGGWCRERLSWTSLEGPQSKGSAHS